MAVITSVANPAVKAARKLARRPAREARDLLVEGPQGVAEALPHLRRLFVTARGRAQASDLVAAAAARAVDIVEVTEDVFATLAETVTPQGLVGVATLPAAGIDALTRSSLAVVLGHVRDPGNAGTAIRTADAMGADAVALTAGSVAIANPKVVRASAGSIFHIPVVEDVDPRELIDSARSAGLQLVAADAQGEVIYSDVTFTRPTALVFGNEAWGLDPVLADGCDVVARFPLHSAQRPGFHGQAESLNLAATVAVFLAEAARQRRGAGASGGTA